MYKHRSRNLAHWTRYLKTVREGRLAISPPIENHAHDTRFLDYPIAFALFFDMRQVTATNFSVSYVIISIAVIMILYARVYGKKLAYSIKRLNTAVFAALPPEEA